MTILSKTRLELDTRRLAAMVAAGLTLDHALETLTRGRGSVTGRNAWAEVLRRVREGCGFAESLRDHPRHFDRLYVASVAAGEGCGTLDASLEGVADALARRRALRGKIFSVSLYPLTVTVIATTIAVMLALFVVPVFAKMFAGFDTALPMPTRVMIASSRGLLAHGPTIALLLLLVAVLLRALARSAVGETVAPAIGRVLLQVPVVGPIIWSAQTTRFAHTLGMAIDVGIPLLQAMDMATESLGLAELRRRARCVRGQVSDGWVFWVAASSAQLFPLEALRVLEVGERVGTLPTSLLRVTKQQDRELDDRTSAVLMLSGPALLLFTGGLVAAVLVSMYLPVFRVTSCFI